MPTTKRRRKRRSRPKRPTKKFCRMTTPEDEQTLIDQIDLRQTELLDQLAALNSRVESLLEEWTQTRDENRVDENRVDEVRVDEVEPASPAGPSAPTFQLPSANAAPQEC